MAIRSGIAVVAILPRFIAASNAVKFVRIAIDIYILS